MDKYQIYALNKAKIKDLQDECKKIEEELLVEVHAAGEPIKKDYGSFSIMKRRSFEYSEKLTKKIEEVEQAKKVEEIKGIASVTEKEFFKFIPSKYAMPKYDFSKVKSPLNLQSISKN